MEENVYLDKLERRDIKPTAIRLLILKNMLKLDGPYRYWIWKLSWIR